MTNMEESHITHEMTKLKLEIDDFTKRISADRMWTQCSFSECIHTKVACLHTYIDVLHILGYDALWWDSLQSYIIELMYPF